MSYSYVALVVLGTGGMAGLLAWIIRRLVPLTVLRRHHEVGSSVFLQLGVIFAVLLAFVFSEVWSEYNTAASAINRECGSLHGVVLLSEALPPADRDEITRAIDAYLRAAIVDEWPRMERREASPEAEDRFYALMTLAGRLQLGEGGPDAVRSQILSLLATAHQYREIRLFQMVQAVPHLVWGLLISFATILTGFLLCFGIDYVPSQVIFTAVFAASTAFVLVLVQLLDFPFEGALRLPPDDLRITLQLITFHESQDAAVRRSHP